jgi:hypothetical protein
VDRVDELLLKLVKLCQYNSQIHLRPLRDA